jgi:ribulose-phosphate 3-epimerase
MQIKIAPSMVECDLAHLADAIAEVEDGGADVLHVDVADGHFVPNMMLGPDVMRAVASCAAVPVNVHLMITDPMRYAPAFAKAGADGIFFHVEAVDDLLGTIRAIRALGVGVGVALKPATPPESIEAAVGELECLMAMTVEPGFSGQPFMESGCRKIPALRKTFGPDIDIYVDGGINLETASIAVRYGANVLVAGKAIFHAALPPAEAARQLRHAATAALGKGAQPR